MSFTQFQTTDKVIDDRMNLFGNELISQITKYSTYDLYLKAGNLMNTQKPTGAGSLITFANVTETEQLAFTFNYAIPEQLIISRDNRYNMVIPFEGLESNRSYIFRYLYTHEGTTIFDITRNAVTTATGKFTAEFQALNQNATDITAEANSTVTLRIYVRTIAGTDAQISLLVNDVNALGRLSRNEATAVITADNVLMPDGVTPVSSAIGQIADDRGYVNSKLITDLNSAQTNGKYSFTNTALNAPADSYGIVDVTVFNASFIKQTANLLSGRSYERLFNGPSWSAWQEISYTTAMVLSILNGWQGEMTIAKSGQMVVINISILGGTVTNGTILANVPVMYRPIGNNYAAVHSDNGYAYIVKISTDGNISIDNFATDWTNSHKIGCIAYSLI